MISPEGDGCYRGEDDETGSGLRLTGVQEALLPVQGRLPIMTQATG